MSRGERGLAIQSKPGHEPNRTLCGRYVPESWNQLLVGGKTKCVCGRGGTLLALFSAFAEIRQSHAEKLW
jgi:hypothetical protein